MSNYRLEGIRVLLKIVGIAFLIAIFVGGLQECNAQDSTQKETGFKGILERRQKRLNKVLERERQAEQQSILFLKEQSVGDMLSKGSKTANVGILISVVGIASSIFINDAEVQKAVILGSAGVGSLTFIMGFEKISMAGKILKLRGM